jgi:hypothetical protein
MKKLVLILAAFTLLLPLASRASIFDAPDILQENSGALGAFGELLLSDPTSEGIEVHGRYGLSDDLNVAAILGTGSKGKKLRFGGEAVLNFIPDYEGQLGLSALGTALYLDRLNTGGLQMRVGLMAHKKFRGFGLNPAIVYFAIPFYLEGRKGNYTTGSQLVLGSLLDLTDTGRYYMDAEAGVKLGKSDSYILAGVGVRFGELKFEKRTRGTPSNPQNRGDRDYRDEDFK